MARPCGRLLLTSWRTVLRDALESIVSEAQAYKAKVTDHHVLNIKLMHGRG